MSSPPPERGQDSPSDRTISSLVWDTVASIIPGVDRNRSKLNSRRIQPDTEDVLYLMDMDGEGLCYHQLFKSSKAFNKK